MKCDKCNGTGCLPEPLPEWLTLAIESGMRVSRLNWSGLTIDLARHIATAYRAHVEAKAKAAAGQIDGVSEFTRTVIERIIRECFLEDR